MSWGDPFEKFYKSDDDDVRRQSIVTRGLTPGVLVSFGKLGEGLAKNVHVWTFPDLTSDSFPVSPGVAVILGVDCESDPTSDWLMVLLNTPGGQSFGWLPTSMVKKL